MAKFPHDRQHKVGRSILGDFMNDDLNERVYDKLIEASDKVQEVLNILRDYKDPQSCFDMGVLTAAQENIESVIDPDYLPLQQAFGRRVAEHLMWAMEKVREDRAANG